MQKRLAQRRLNFVDGWVRSHCRILNSAERNLLIKQSDEVAMVMTDLENANIKEHKFKQKQKELEAIAKKEKTENRMKEEQEKAKKAINENKNTMEEINTKGFYNVKLTVAKLKIPFVIISAPCNTRT